MSLWFQLQPAPLSCLPLKKTKQPIRPETLKALWYKSHYTVQQGHTSISTVWCDLCPPGVQLYISLHHFSTAFKPSSFSDVETMAGGGFMLPFRAWSCCVLLLGLSKASHCTHSINWTCYCSVSQALVNKMTETQVCFCIHWFSICFHSPSCTCTHFHSPLSHSPSLHSADICSASSRSRFLFFILTVREGTSVLAAAS